MTRKVVFRDMDACINCKACVIACKVKHMSPVYPATPAPPTPGIRSLVNIYRCGPEMRGDRVYQSFVSIACMHCEDAACMRVCPVSAIRKDAETGITLVEHALCIGCNACLWVCPYGAPSFDEAGKLMLCDLCIDRLKEGKKTACEAACQAAAIFVGTAEEVSELQARKAVGRIEKGMMV